MLKAEIEKIAVSFNKGTPLPIRPELDWCRNPITGEYAERLLTAGYLRHPDFAGEPIDDDGHAVARVVDEQSLPRRMRLPHRRRQRFLERAIELTKTAVAVPARMGGDVFVPDDLQRDVLALQLAVNRRPVRLGVDRK